MIKRNLNPELEVIKCCMDCEYCKKIIINSDTVFLRCLKYNYTSNNIVYDYQHAKENDLVYDYVYDNWFLKCELESI